MIKITLRTYQIFLFLVFSIEVFCQGDTITEKLYSDLESLAQMETVFVIKANNPKKLIFKEVLKFTQDQLEFHILDSNQYVAAYSILALMEKDSFQISHLKNYTFDGRKVRVNEWGEEYYLGEFILRLINDLTNINYVPNQKEIKETYVYFLDQEIKPVFYRYLLLSVKPYPEIYTKIKSTFLEGKIQEAIVPLSKYKNSEIANILNIALRKEGCDNWVLRAIENNRDKSFLPILREKLFEYSQDKYLHGNKEYMLLEVLASYKSKRAYKIMEELLQKRCARKFKREVYSGYIKEVLDRYPPPANLILPEPLIEINRLRMAENERDFK